MEDKEREEGEIIFLTIILKNSTEIPDPNFVTFIIEKVLVWSENAYDEYFLHIIQDYEDMFKPHAKLLLNLFKTKIAESDFNLKYHHIVEMNEEKVLKKSFGTDI